MDQKNTGLGSYTNIQNNPAAASEVGNAVYGAATDDPNEPFPSPSGLSSDAGRAVSKLWTGFKDVEGFIKSTAKGIDGAIKHSKDATLIFDAAKEISKDGKTLTLKNLGVYTAENFGDISNQGAVGPKNILKYMNDIGKWAKEQGFEKLEISFKRARPDGSPLPDSENRVIPIDLSKIK